MIYERSTHGKGWRSRSQYPTMKYTRLRNPEYNN